MQRVSASDHPEKLLTAASALVARLSRVVDRESLLDDCLDLLVGALAADRGLVLLRDSESTWYVHGRSARQRLDDDECEELSRTILERALSGEDVVTWSPLDAGTESLVSFGITAALAVPLRALPGEPHPSPLLGALYLDYRRLDVELSAGHREVLDIAGRVVSIALGRLQLTQQLENDRRLKQSTHVSDNLPDLDTLLASSGLAHTKQLARAAALGCMPVLITGETGTGKTLLAHALAQASNRQPVVRATLGASDDLNTIVSELFGHERGAFSGAVSRRTGLVEYADGGVLVLDEILNMPLPAQQILLDLVQFQSYRPLGWARPAPKQANLWIIAATQGDLKRAVAQGKFREDLYHRLAGVEFVLPPLRERRELIPGLAQEYLARTSELRLSSAAIATLGAADQDWPGNVRQLEQVLERARLLALTSNVAEVDPSLLMLTPGPARTANPSGEPRESATLLSALGLPTRWRELQRAQGALEATERELLCEALDRHNGVVARVARDFGLARSSLLSRMRTLGIQRAGDDG